MIKITDNSHDLELFFPKHEEKGLDSYHVVIHSNLTLEDYEFDCTDGDFLSDYYKFTMNLSALPNGEYTYVIGDDYSKGLIYIGERFCTVNQYENNEEYKQYEF